MTYRISRRGLIGAVAAFSAVPSAVAAPPGGAGTEDGAAVYTNDALGRLLRKHKLPRDWGESAGLTPTLWKGASEMKYRSADKAMDPPELWRLYRTTIIVDIDGLFWNRNEVTLDELEKRVTKLTDRPSVAVTWHDLVLREDVYHVMWILNDAGVVPVLAMPHLSKRVPRSGK